MNCFNEIMRLNPSVKLIVNTTYNPYNESDPLHNTVDSYLFRTDGLGINNLVLSKASELKYSVADIYLHFDQYYRNNKGAVTYFYPTDFWGTLTRNPHPNTLGQNNLTNLVENAYTSLASIQPLVAK